MAGIPGGLLERWLTVDRHRHVARYELTVESLRRPDIASELQVAGQRLREGVADLLAAALAPRRRTSPDRRDV